MGCHYMIIVSTNIAILYLASELNMGTIVATEAWACGSVYVNWRICISSAFRGERLWAVPWIDGEKAGYAQKRAIPDEAWRRFGDLPSIWPVIPRYQLVTIGKGGWSWVFQPVLQAFTLYVQLDHCWAFSLFSCSLPRALCKVPLRTNLNVNAYWLSGLPWFSRHYRVTYAFFLLLSSICLQCPYRCGISKFWDVSQCL